MLAADKYKEVHFNINTFLWNYIVFYCQTVIGCVIKNNLSVFFATGCILCFTLS